MSMSLGPFYTCFLATLFLVVYLHVFIRHSKAFQEKLLQCSMIGIVIILLRMIIPINFSFTYTIYSHKILPALIDVTTYYIGNTKWQIRDLMFFTWIVIAAFLLIRLGIQYFQLKQSLKIFLVEKDDEHQYLYDLLSQYSEKPLQIAIVPENISPAITGVCKPVLILPEVKTFSSKELEYIFAHELAHYKKKHLWFGLIMEICCRIHWWNPVVQYAKKDFSLFLELSNDFLLIQSMSEVEKVEYANLIISTAKKIYLSKNIIPTPILNFVINNKSILKTRIDLITTRDSMQHKNTWKNFCCMGIVSIAVLLTIGVVPEASFPDNPKILDGSVKITEENAYIIETETGYEIYVNGDFFVTIPQIIREFESLPVYKKGVTYEK